MRRAIALSAFGLGWTSPNPPVGCVILDAAGSIVGEGYHRRKGEAHAEVNALSAAADRARAGTAVVTLEPCNHDGRTPACRQELTKAGVTRVVIALLDPTSRQEGGAERLRAAGVDVEVGTLADEARLVIGPWLTALQTKRPDVHWAFVIDEHNANDQPADVDNLRAQADAVLTHDGHLEEGVPGAHGEDVFSLPRLLDEDPQAMLRDMYDSGVRSLLVLGQTTIANAMAAIGVVDRVTCYVSRREPSSPRRTYSAPTGFSLRTVSPCGNFVRLELRPDTMHVKS